MKKCAEIVVTYNREKLLKENIDSLLSQTYKNHDIIIIDNASTDNTKEMISTYKDNRIKYFNTGKNLGGAGGFSYGIKKALTENDYDYLWIMDDDSIPQNTALESLINKANILEDNFSYLASLVYWTDNKLFPMNIPVIEYQYTMLDIISRHKLVPIISSSFVGCFVNVKYVKKIGLPIKEFFIYGDDIEYTSRLHKIEKSYLDLDSIIIHKAPSNKGADIATADEDRIKRFYYQSRNRVYIARKTRKMLDTIKTIIIRTGKIIIKAPNHRGKRLWYLYKGSFAGLFFNPKIEHIKEK